MAQKKPAKKAMSKKSMKTTKGGSFSFGAPKGGVQLPAVQSSTLNGGVNQCCNGEH
jgi:hypothetical protein